MGLFPRNINEYVALQGVPRGPNSQVYLVDPANGSDSNSGTSVNAPLASIEAAYAKCTANQHDVVLYISGSSGNNLAAAMTWSKSYTHLLGWCAPTHAAQRARIFQTATLTGASPLITISAQGCIFRDLYIFQGVDDATSLINVSVTGGRNYFENVHFAGAGHATQAIDGGHSLKLDGAEENTFRNCTFGVDTVDAVDGVTAILMDGEAHRNLFENCIFRLRCAAGDTGPAFVEVADATGIDRDTLFKNCTFLNNSATAMASAFAIPAGMGAPRTLLLQNCMFLGVTKLDANDRGVLKGNMGAVTGADLSGVAVNMYV